MGNEEKKICTCRICKTKEEMQTYIVREMMWNTRDEFEYFVCPNCNCLQISEIPSDLEKYYGENYYSFQLEANQNSIFSSNVVNSDKILDVGCGTGRWLFERASEGYDNLYGIEPYIDKDIDYGNRVHIMKGTILDVEGDNTFDLIRMGDSLEHMENPVEVLKKARELLKEDGYIAINIPIFPNIAFNMFGTNWFQIDAPRHIFIPSKETIAYFAEVCKLQVVRINYNSCEKQIICSFLYQKDIPLLEHTSEVVQRYFSNNEIYEISRMTDECNKNQCSDHVEIYMKKK